MIDLSDYELLEIMRGTLMAHGAIEPDARDISELINEPETPAALAVLRNVIAADRARCRDAVLLTGTSVSGVAE